MRARIAKVNSQSLACNVETRELTGEEASLHLKGGESSFQDWIQNPVKASFRLDPELLALARSFRNTNVVLSVDGEKVVAIAAVRDGPLCHFCGSRRFTGEFLHEALCNRLACRKLIKELLVVTRPREKEEMWGGDISGIESRYVYQSPNGRREHTPWESPGKHRFLGREFFHVYRAHRAKICAACQEQQEVWKLPDLKRRLQDEFEHNKRTYNVTGAVIVE
ncbi:MAG: hypothetical protein JRM80_05510 [Nitrososphaerota archaeon]|nr:hypothetical protein [Nitrososphaerota archaeon]